VKFLIIGLGSMGKRRVRNLQKLGYDDIIGYDTRKDRREETEKKYRIRTISDLSDGFAKKPDLMIISTPPDLHLKYANMAIKKNINFFTEVNLLSQHVVKMKKKVHDKSLIALPSSTMRFHPMVMKLKKLIQSGTIGKVLVIHHHAGQLLSNWHPWEDYREFFVSKRKTGGSREIIPVELVWLTYLFSDVKSIIAKADKVSMLDADIDDVFHMILEFKNKILCSMAIDVISIPSFRETKIIGEKGTIKCNFNDGLLMINKGTQWKEIKLKMGQAAKGYKRSTPPDTLYENEIENVLAIVKGQKKSRYGFDDELKILRILDAAELSSKKGKKIILG